MIKIKKGLDLPIEGRPSQEIVNAPPSTRIALTGYDYVGMKPTLLVQEGQKVKKGEPLFQCKKRLGVTYTSPGAGTIAAINRGEKRVFQTLEIEVDESQEKEQQEAHHSFSSYSPTKKWQDYSAQEIEALLVESGQWVGLRTRPFSKSPLPGTRPSSLFISTLNTHPLAANPATVIEQNKDYFIAGVKILSKLAKVNLIKKKSTLLAPFEESHIHIHEISGPHPAGNVGTHIHFIDPVGPHKTVWHIGVQDVIGVGHLFKTGRLFVERVVALGGTQVFTPRLLKTRLGANLKTITQGQIKEGPHRMISGSPLNGRQTDDLFSYLGRFHEQISVIEENNQREFLGWQGPGFHKYSVSNTYLGKFVRKTFPFSSSLFGSPRAMVPIGSFEKVMPLDILPTQLLRALSCRDTDLAQDLGALELDEEDLSLCTFVSPGKEDFAPLLREVLDLIEKEG